MSDGMNEMQRRINEEMANWKGNPDKIEIARLTAEVAWHGEDKNKWQDTQAAHLREVTRLRARVEVLEGALNPFADESLWSGPDHEFVTVKRSDCDRARAALEEK